MSHFSLKDGILKVSRAIQTPTGPVPAGLPFRILSFTKLTLDPGGKASHLKGQSFLPIDIVRQTVEPKLSIECSNGVEIWQARNAVGGIGSDMIVNLDFVRFGLAPVSFMFAPAVWMNGGGISLDDGNGAGPGTIEILCTDVLQDLVSIYNQAA